MNEKRQGMVQRVKMVERERDGLEGARAAAEAYLEKERESVSTQCTIFQVSLLVFACWRKVSCSLVK